MDARREVGRNRSTGRAWYFGATGIVLLTFFALADAATVPVNPAADTVARSADEIPRQAIRRVYRQAVKRPLELEIRLPAGWSAAQRRPAIVFWYGGGFWTRNVEQFARQAEYFARRGLVTVLADYETGGLDGTKPPAAFADARSAMRWLRQHAAELGIDPDRIAAAGGSAGGSLAAALAIFEGVEWPGEDSAMPVRPAALLLYNPALGTGQSARITERFGNEETWRKTAAALHVSRHTPPALLLFGSRDPLLAAGRTYAEKLTAAGIRADVQVTEGVGHGFFNAAPHLEQTTGTVDAFLQSLGWLRPEPRVPLPKGDAVLRDTPQNSERAATP